MFLYIIINYAAIVAAGSSNFLNNLITEVVMVVLSTLKSDWSKPANLFSIALIAVVGLMCLLNLVDPASESVRALVAFIFVSGVVIDLSINYFGKKMVRASQLEQYLIPIVGNLLPIMPLIIICIMYQSPGVRFVSVFIVVFELLICKNKITGVDYGEEIHRFISDMSRPFVAAMTALLLFGPKGFWTEATLYMMLVSSITIVWSYRDNRKRYNRKFRRQCAM